VDPRSAKTCEGFFVNIGGSTKKDYAFNALFCHQVLLVRYQLLQKLINFVAIIEKTHFCKMCVTGG